MPRSLIITALLVLAGCGGGSQAGNASVRAAVVSGLIANIEGVSLEQVTTFQGEILGNWAIAYDPGEPPGCTAGGLWGEPKGPAIADVPCQAYLLVRRKARWTVLSFGIPGAFVPPEDAPEAMGDPDKLVFLGD